MRGNILLRAGLIAIMGATLVGLGWMLPVTFGYDRQPIVAVISAVAAFFVGVCASWWTLRLQRRRISVFLSHSNEDVEFSRHIARSLSAYGYTLFLADDEINVGEDIRARLRELIRNSELMIVVFSMNTLQSKWIGFELETAQKEGKPILPIVFRGAPIPSWLSHIKYLQATSDSAPPIEDLKRSIRRLSQRSDERQTTPDSGP